MNVAIKNESHFLVTVAKLMQILTQFREKSFTQKIALPI